MNDIVAIGADYCSIGLDFSGLNMSKEGTEYMNKGLNILYEVKKKTGYVHPVIQLIEASLKQVERQNELH